MSSETYTYKSPMACRIEERMSDLGISTVVDAAKKTSVSRAVISNILLNPKKSIMTDTAVLLADGLECQLSWFLTGEGPKTKKETKYYEKRRNSSPVVDLNELITDFIIELLMEKIFKDEERERYSCATGNTETTIAVKLNSDIDCFRRGGYMFFEMSDTQPQSGRYVIARTSKDTPPEIMMYSTAHGRKFLKSLSEDIPNDLRIIEMDDDMKILGTFRAYTLL